MASTLKQMSDAYVLTAVLTYCSITSTTTFSRFFLTFLAVLVLLLNSHYLHAPIHPPSTILALLLLPIPFFPTFSKTLLISFATYLTQAPHFLVQLFIAFILLANFIRLAILRPLQNARAARLAISPISVQPPPSQPISLTPPPTSTSPNPPPVSTSPTPPPASPTPETPPEQPSTTQQTPTPQQLRALRTATTTLSYPPSNPTRPKPRRSPTKSQQVATQILQQRERERQERQAAVQRAEALAKAAAETVRAEREEREKRRKQLVDAVRAAGQAVADAKQKLAEAVVEADRAREARRRAGDQARLSGSVRDEEALDAAIQLARQLEGVERGRLEDVNVAQGRLEEIRETLSRFMRDS